MKKAQLREVRIKYSKLGSFDDLRVLGFTDSSYRNADNMTKSVGGRIIFLVNKTGQCSPIAWKSKTIPQVCKSVKSAETRSLDLGIEDTIFLSKMLSELYFGDEAANHRIPIEMKIDSKTLFDSLHSSKQVEEKSIRHVIAWMKQQLESKLVNKVSWVSTTDMLADIFTKKNVNADSIMTAISLGFIDTMTQ